MEAISWASREFCNIDLGDKRLNARLVKLCDSLSESPESPINQACQDWAETKAAYRFFRNDNVDVTEIISCHREKTIERVSEHRTVLAIQDTSYIIYTNHPKTSGLGKLTMVKGKRIKEIYSKGLLMHSCLAVTTDGVPLGLLDQNIFSRPDVAKKKGRAKDIQPVEEKESYRWLESLQKSVQAVGITQIVTVCDREADMYEFFERAQQTSSSVLVRAKVNRAVNKSSMYTEQAVEKLWSFMDSQPVAGKLNVDITEREATKHSPKREARIAEVEVRFGSFQMNPPKRLSSNSPDIEMSAVYLLEKDAPEGIEPVEWMLLTDIEVSSFEQACEKVRWYQMRWRIEMFFKTLKSGFRVEECRLGDADRLIRYLAIMSIVAWRLFALTFIARCAPDTDCNSLLTDKEWKVLFLKANKNNKNIPARPPNIKNVVRWIAQLGGFLGRKNDGEPGTLVLWRGWKKLQDIIDGFDLARFAHTCG